MSKEGKRHIKNCRELYDRTPSPHGPSAVYSYANKEGITDWRYCKGCEADTPTADDTCLVCGGNQEGRPHTTEARDVTVITEGKNKLELIAIIDGKKFVFSAHRRTDPNFPGIDINVNGDIAAVVEYTSTDEEIKIRTFTKESDEPVTNITYEKVN